jgi:aminoglycoside phosphotransferase (APT) family kinase protein
MSPLIPQRYSERLGVLEPDQLRDAAERFDLGELIDAEPASGGLFGQNVFLTTTQGEFVLRGHPHGHVQLTKERRVARFINERSSLPVPWPYQVCDDASTFGWTYAIMPRLEGESGSDLRVLADEERRLELADAAGEALAMLHEAQTDFFGPYDAQLDDFIALDDFPDWFLHRLEHWRSACRAVNAMSTEAELYIDDLIEKHADALKEPFTPVLVHHDFKLGNLNFDPDTLDPTGVFDLFEAYIGDPEEDVVRMLWTVDTDEERKAFVESYTSERPFRPGAADRLTLYALCDWLVVWEYGRRIGSWFEDTTFMESIQPILRNAQAIGSTRQ